MAIYLDHAATTPMPTHDGGRPVMFGGDPDKARHHFNRAIEITGGKFLLAQFLLAKYYAVPAQNRELYEKTLNDILSAPGDLHPEQGLANRHRLE